MGGAGREAWAVPVAAQRASTGKLARCQVVGRQQPRYWVGCSHIFFVYLLPHTTRETDTKSSPIADLVMLCHQHLHSACQIMSLRNVPRERVTEIPTRALAKRAMSEWFIRGEQYIQTPPRGQPGAEILTKADLRMNSIGCHPGNQVTGFYAQCSTYHSKVACATIVRDGAGAGTIQR